jgi:hypothetical protein
MRKILILIALTASLFASHKVCVEADECFEVDENTYIRSKTSLSVDINMDGVGEFNYECYAPKKTKKGALYPVKMTRGSSSVKKEDSIYCEYILKDFFANYAK